MKMYSLPFSLLDLLFRDDVAPDDAFREFAGDDDELTLILEVEEIAIDDNA